MPTFATVSMNFVPRPRFFEALHSAIQRFPVTALLGPRQCGKSTLARLLSPRIENRFDLENPLDLLRLQPDPLGRLGALEGVVVIDEVQLWPELFAYLRVLVDDPGCRGRFLITGSASPDLIRETSETLAGRVRLIELGGFDLSETGPVHWETLWLRGGFPRSFLSESAETCREWWDSFLKTYLFRDIQRLAGSTLPAPRLAQLLALFAHYHGQTWNRDEVATALGIDTKTVQRYVDVFEEAYLIRVLRPYEANVGKRIRRAPRLFFRDTGLLHTLLGLHDRTALLTHARSGASWEGFVIENLARLLRCGDACYFWRTQGGDEIDLVVPRAGRLLGFECKMAEMPAATPGMLAAIRDLRLDQVYVVHRGGERRRLGDRIESIPVTRLEEICAELGSG
jgi:predicted AAA+ superfamily ATPase